MEDEEKNKNENKGNEDTKKNQWGQDVPCDPETQQFAPKDGSGDSSSKEEVKPFSFFSKMDWGLSLKEHAIAENQYAEIIKNNKEQIEEAEKKLGDKAKAINEVWGDMYDFDIDLLSKATPEQLDELMQAIEDKTVAEFNAEQNKEKQKQLENNIAKIKSFGSEISYIWKSKPYLQVEDYPDFKDKIQEKIDWYKEQLASENPQYITTSMPNKIKALEQWKNKYDELQEEKKKLDEISQGSPKAGLLEGYNAVIAKYQDSSSMYSQVRKNKAIWCQSKEESMKNFSLEAKKQRANMTPEEIDCLKSYTGAGASTINMPLNALKYSSGWGSSGKKKGFEQAKLMTSALDKSISSKDVWLQRGVSGMHFGGIDFSDIEQGKVELSSMIGKEFINNSFMSCGTAKNTGFDGPLILNIYCPKGTKMNYVNEISHFKGHENETIINRGYHFIIKKMEKNKNGQFFVDIDLIVGSDSDRLTDEQMKKLYDKYL